MKSFLTLSALLSAAAAVPHLHHAHPHAPTVYYPHPVFAAPTAYAQFAAAAYHSDAAANCRPEKEVFNVQSCLPNFQIVCEDAKIQQETIKYEKKCVDVVNQVCGNHHPVAVTMEENDNGEVETMADDALPVENKVYYVLPGAPVLRHKCWDVPQQHCYLEPTVETQEATVPKCHVVNKPVCTETSHEVSKVVCNKEPEAEVAEKDADFHVHEDGVAHSHEGGAEPHDHAADAVAEHVHADGTEHAHPAGAIPHEHETHSHTHTHADGTTHSHPHVEGHHAAEPYAVHAHAHKHADGTQHAHAHAPFHHVSPYKVYYYYPAQNLYKQFGLYNVYA